MKFIGKAFYDTIIGLVGREIMKSLLRYCNGVKIQVKSPFQSTVWSESVGKILDLSLVNFVDQKKLGKGNLTCNFQVD